MSRKKVNTSGLSWEPIRRGEIYCAPACGHGCTFSMFKRAHAKAKALARRLGKGLKPHVWENLGWHWEVTNGVLRVDRDRFDPAESYCCMLSPHYSWFGKPQHRPTPEEAIAATVAMAIIQMDEIVSIRNRAIQIAQETLRGHPKPHATLQRAIIYGK